MKKLLIPLLIITGFSCSTPKNYYMFNKPKNSATDRVITREHTDISKEEVEESPIILSEPELNQVAMSIEEPEIVTTAPVPVFNKEEYKAMSKADKKATRKLVKKEIKNYIKNGRAKAKGEEVKATHDIQLTGYTRIGALLIAGGLLLMILTNGTVADLGALLVLIGVVLIIIDLV